MDNPRPEKVAVVDEVKEKFSSSSAAILTEYRGLKVKDMAVLRRSLRDAGGEYRVYKNTLVRFAARDLGLELDAMLEGPTAIAFVEGDAVTVAKALRDYARTNPALVIKGGLLGDSVLDATAASALAELPSREVLLARIAGGLAAPMVQFAGLLQALPRNMAYGLKALVDKRVASGEALPAAEPEAATEATSAEPAADATTADAPEAATPAAEADAATEATSAEPAADATTADAADAPEAATPAAEAEAATDAAAPTDATEATPADAPEAPALAADADATATADADADAKATADAPEAATPAADAEAAAPADAEAEAAAPEAPAAKADAPEANAAAGAPETEAPAAEAPAAEAAAPEAATDTETVTEETAESPESSE